MGRAAYGAGSVVDKGGGRYQLRWSEGRDPFTGEHRRKAETITAPTMKAARAELAKRVAARGTRSDMTVGQLIDVALEQIPIADVTRETYGYALAHIPDIARGWVAAEVSVVDARTIMDGLAARHSPAMVQKIHGALMSVWRESTLAGWVTTNPWRGQRCPSVPASAGNPLTDEEVAKLRRACKLDIDRAWIDLHLATGARPGEAVGLRWSAIDKDELVVTIVDAKHDDRPRFVAVDATTMKSIDKWRRVQKKRALGVGVPLDEDPWLLSGDEASSVPWRRTYAGGFRWRKLRDAAGIRSELRLYDLRHTHNSWLAAAGIDEATRGLRIGNTPSTNLSTYSHALRDREAADVVAERVLAICRRRVRVDRARD
ncbi:MAG: tyrosine-type recombinase/integrase [Actinomycetota bacterium]